MSIRTRILIGTPSLGREVTTEYLSSVFGLQNYLRGSEVHLDLLTLSTSQIDVSRNLIASVVLDQKQFTHLLFIDADMGFRPELITDMLEFNKPVVGVVSPVKQIDLQMVRQLRGDVDGDVVQYLVNPYVPPMLRGVMTKNGKFALAHEAGTGIMLIQRQVLEQIAALPGMIIRNYKPPFPGLSTTLLNCFHRMTDHNNISISEDLSFCRRWVNECSGEIWVSIGHEITHTGSFTFKGRYLDKMQVPHHFSP